MLSEPWRDSVRPESSQPPTPIAAMPKVAFLFGVETDAAGDVRDVHVSVIQRGGSQLAHTGVRAGRKGASLARNAVEHPDHPQALGKGAVVDGVGQPFKAWHFGLCNLAGVGQGRDETAFDTGVVA